MSFGEAIVSVFSKYAEFSGRARRSEYWYFVLFQILLSAALTLVAYMVPALAILGSIASLALFIPSLAVQVRRLHDIGKSGWYIFIVFIPLVGVILLLIWLCREGTPQQQPVWPIAEMTPWICR